MALNKLYRSFLIAGFAAAALATASCDSQKTHKTISQEQHERWNLAKLSVMYQLAQQQYEVGDYDKCRKTLDEALAMKEPHAGLQILAARVQIEKGSLEVAADHLKEAIRINAADPQPYYLLGVVYQRWQKMEVAADYYQQAFDRKPSEALYMLAVVEMKITIGQLDAAQQLLEDKLAYFEQSAAVRVALARIAILKNDYLTASKHYRDAYLLMPDDTGIKRSYAEALYFAGRYSDAVPLLDDLRNHPAATAQSGHPGEKPAEPVQSEADHITLTLMSGQCYLRMHRVSEARACFQEVTRDHPENAGAVLGLGKVCLETNDLNTATAAARRVLRSDPTNVQAQILIATVQQKEKKWADALATLDTAAQAAPKDSTILCMQGVSMLKLGREAEATGFFERAVAANPADRWAADLLARNKPAVSPEQGNAAGAASGDSVTTALPPRENLPEAR